MPQPATVPGEALRTGNTTAVYLAYTADVDAARAAALAWARACPRYAGLTATAKRATLRAYRYHTLGYEGPAVSVTVGFVR